jgi:hypothetical protein
LRHRYDHLSARVTSAGGGRRTSGLAACRASALQAVSANGGRRLVLKLKNTKNVLYLAKLSSRGGGSENQET